MDPHSTAGPSSHSHYSVLSPTYNEQDNSAPLSQGGYFSANTQSSGLEEIQNIGESSSHAYPLPVLYESEYPSISHPVPSMPNHPPQLYSYSLHSSQRPSLTVLTSPFPTDPSQPSTPHSTSSQQYAYSTSRRGGSRQMEQTEIENQNCLSSQNIYSYGVPVLSNSAPPESSSTMIAGSSTSISAEPYTQPGVQDDYDLTSFPLGQVGSTSEDLVTTQGQIATAQERSFSRARRIQRKKEMDKARKRVDRSNDDQDYARICELLNISLRPKKTRAHRILVGVEAIVERQELDDDLRNRLEISEANVRSLKTRLAKVLPGAGADARTAG